MSTHPLGVSTPFAVCPCESGYSSKTNSNSSAKLRIYMRRHFVVRFICSRFCCGRGALKPETLWQPLCGQFHSRIPFFITFCISVVCRHSRRPSEIFKRHEFSSFFLTFDGSVLLSHFLLYIFLIFYIIPSILVPFLFLLFLPVFIPFLVAIIAFYYQYVFLYCTYLLMWIYLFSPECSFPASPVSTLCPMNLVFHQSEGLWPLHAKRPAELPAECKRLVESERPAINEIVLSNSSGAAAGITGYCTWNIVYYLRIVKWKVIHLYNLCRWLVRQLKSYIFRFRGRKVYAFRLMSAESVAYCTRHMLDLQTVTGHMAVDACWTWR